MKTVVILASILALTAVGAVSTITAYKIETVEPDFLDKQNKVLSLLHVPSQVDVDSEYYKVAMNFNIEANIDNYTNKTAVEEFLSLYKQGFMPKYFTFSIFHEKQKEQAIALFYLFFYAKDFDTFYKTAAYARVHVNDGLFIYTYFIAVVHRPDTKGIVLPAPYEIYPELFVNAPAYFNAYRAQMQGDVFSKEEALKYGGVTENNYYVFYANYSDSLAYPNEEYKISYFTEDIGWNAYYFTFHVYFPFWLDGDKYTAMKERRGEIYFYFYQQLLARYYLERLSNGLGEIPEFSWRYPIKTGYNSPLVYNVPFAQRPNDYQIPYEKHIMELQFLDTYEKTFIQYLEKGYIKEHNVDVDLANASSINYLGNYWEGNYDFYKFYPKNSYYSYETTARHVLGAAAESVDTYTFQPSVLSFYQTSMRDPVFFQLFNKILGYMFEYKQYLTPYTPDILRYDGVKIEDVRVYKMVTYFDYFDFDISNGIYHKLEEYKSSKSPIFKIRTPRLNHKPFRVTVTIKSDIEAESLFKICLGPKFDNNGYPIPLEESWKYFIELDWFVHKLIPGQNKIERSSADFFAFKEDAVTIADILKLVEQGKIPLHMSKKNDFMANRLMLPRGTQEGFPYQLFVMVSSYQPPLVDQSVFFVDSKPLSFPFDRPVYEPYFKQPNMFFKDIKIYHEGEMFSYKYNVPPFNNQYNEVTKN